jgi:hypothetical protein
MPKKEEDELKTTFNDLIKKCEMSTLNLDKLIQKIKEKIKIKNKKTSDTKHLSKK